MQNLHLLGRTTAKPEIHESQQQKSFATFSLAVNRYRKGQDDPETTFYDCLCFLPTAEKLAEKIDKGEKVFIAGRPEASAYINKDGEAIGQLKVIVDQWESLK